MKFVGWLFVTLLIVGNVAVPRVFAQSVLSSQDNWAATAPPPPVPGPAFGDPSSTSGTVNTTAQNLTTWDGAGLLQLETKGTVVNNYATTPNQFGWTITREQKFVLNEAAYVILPSFLRGYIQTDGGVGTVAGKAMVFNALATSDADSFVTAQLSDTFNVYGNVTHNTNLFQYAESATPLAAGTYWLRATLTVSGVGGDTATAPGSTATVHYFGDTAAEYPFGFATSLAAVPAGLGDSRAAVNAPLARSNYGVTGDGIKVGVVETGSAYTGHSALPNARLTLVNADGKDYSREHALASSGIIAGEDLDTSHAGIAPEAHIYSASINSWGSTGTAISKLMLQNVQVLNMSASDPGYTAGDANLLINGKPGLTFVVSAGNSGTSPGNTIGSPGMSMNVITVGALNRDFTKRAAFSSTSDFNRPIKPDIVAPGEYIMAPMARDLTGGNIVNDFSNTFLGEDLAHISATSNGNVSPHTGDITGTSFSAPIVSGAAALLLDYQSQHAAHHSDDHRVIKAILLNGASTAVQHGDGGAWAQFTNGSLAAGTYTVTRSLDEELGAGMLNVDESLSNYAPDKITDPVANADSNLNVDAEGHPKFWDLKNAVSGGGKINYLLGYVGGAHLRATLTWDYDAAGGTGLMPLNLKLFHEGTDDGNPIGWDVNDTVIGQTVSTVSFENVKLLDITIPDFGHQENDGYYLQVLNNGGTDTTFGLAVMVPEPGTMAIAALGMLLAIKRRSRS